jgi:hypothetical protein
MSPRLGIEPQVTSPQTSEPKRRWWQVWRKGEGETIALLASAFFYLFLAGVFYLIKFYLEKTARDGADLAQHVSLAFFVAFVSILGIENNAKQRAERELQKVIQRFDDYRKQVSEDVLKAVLGLVIQSHLRAEIMAIFRIPFIKTKCQYTFRFLSPGRALPEGYCIVQRDLEFVVTNVSEAPQQFPVRSSYASDEDLEAAK